MRLFAAAIAFIVALQALEASAQVIRVGVLKHGTAHWEVDAIERYGLLRESGVEVRTSEFASADASRIALLAGAVDLIVNDWIWAARQRAEGRLLVFEPYASPIGSLLAAPSGPGSIAEVDGMKIGVAGGPLDKNWLLLRARLGKDVRVQPVFGSPPLLEAEYRSGRLSLLLTHWHFAARLRAEGARTLLDMRDVSARLTGGDPPPMLGWIALESWAEQNVSALTGFLEAAGAARARLSSDDAEWARIGRRIGVADQRVLRDIREQYANAGAPLEAAAARKAARRLFDVLRVTGGEALTGRSTELPERVFMSAAFNRP